MTRINGPAPVLPFMTKLPTPTPVLSAPGPAAQKLELLRELFPAAVQTDEHGHISISAAAIQQALDPANPAGIRVEEDGYELRWAGKREAYHTAFVPPERILQPLEGDSKAWETTGNVLLKGDNLDALRLLRQSYTGAIKLIYIDPPYNTQSDAFIYRDDFSTKQSEILKALGYKADALEYIQNIYGARTHSGWLSFMYPRLLLAKDLLAEDGVIFISIDDNEQAQLKLLCDEVFGQESFVGQLIWKKKSGGANDSEHFAIDHEYVLVYAKRKEQFELGIDKAATVTTSYNREDEKGRYALDRLDKQSIRYSDSGNFEITGPDGTKYWPAHKDPKKPNATWRWSKKTVARDYKQLVFENGCIYTKNYEGEGGVARSLMIEDRFGRTRTGKTDLSALIDGAVFNSPKPVKLVKFFGEIVLNRDDIVLDFFAGSGTTAEAVMRLNAEDEGTRKFILVQIPQPIDAKKQKDAHAFVTETLGKTDATIFEITAERIRRAGAALQADHPQLDTGFRVYELAEDPDALILRKPLAEATQDDLLGLQQRFTTAQPGQVPRVLANLLLAEGLPLSARIEVLQDDTLYRADDVLFLLQAVDTAVLREALQEAKAAGRPIHAISAYAPWLQDDNLLLGLKTLLETLDLSEDKLRLRS